MALEYEAKPRCGSVGSTLFPRSRRFCRSGYRPPGHWSDVCSSEFLPDPELTPAKESWRIYYQYNPSRPTAAVTGNGPGAAMATDPPPTRKESQNIALAPAHRGISLCAKPNVGRVFRTLRLTEILQLNDQ